MVDLNDAQISPPSLSTRSRFACFARTLHRQFSHLAMFGYKGHTGLLVYWERWRKKYLTEIREHHKLRNR